MFWKYSKLSLSCSRNTMNRHSLDLQRGATRGPSLMLTSGQPQRRHTPLLPSPFCALHCPSGFQDCSRGNSGSRGTHISASSSSSTNSPNLGPADLPAVALPQSQDLAIAEAVRSVQIAFQPIQASLKSKAVVGKSPARKKGQGFVVPKPSPTPPPAVAGPSGSNTFAIEIPSADQSPASVAETCLAVAGQLLRQLQLPASTLTLVLADEAAAAATAALLQQQRKQGSSSSSSSGAAAAAGVANVLSLTAACRSSDGLRGAVLLLVEPKVSDVALVEQLLSEVWTGASCVMLNPEFPAAPVPEQYKKVSDSIRVVWSFLPLMVSGLLGNMEGAVLRRLTQAGQEEGWAILYNVGDKYVQVGLTKQRPKQDDLELTIMNASAAASPLTRTVKMFKSLLPKLPGKK